MRTLVKIGLVSISALMLSWCSSISDLSVSTEMNSFISMIDGNDTSIKEALVLYGEDRNIYDSEMTFLDIEDVQILAKNNGKIRESYDICIKAKTWENTYQTVLAKVYWKDGKINEIKYTGYGDENDLAI